MPQTSRFTDAERAEILRDAEAILADPSLRVNADGSPVRRIETREATRLDQRSNLIEDDHSVALADHDKREARYRAYFAGLPDTLLNRQAEGLPRLFNDSGSDEDGQIRIHWERVLAEIARRRPGYNVARAFARAAAQVRAQASRGGS